MKAWCTCTVVFDQDRKSVLLGVMFPVLLPGGGFLRIDERKSKIQSKKGRGPRGNVLVKTT